MGKRVLVVGGGIFGATAACELASRGHEVELVDPGPLPHPQAASTDISKVIRLEYGADEEYMTWMEAAREGWLRWNAEALRAQQDPLYHETGVLMLSRDALRPGGFEHDSYRLLVARGHRPERLDGAELSRRFPAWNATAFVDGFFHALGGYVESGRVVARLLDRARGLGVRLRTGAQVEGIEAGAASRTGVRLTSGERLAAEVVLVAAGSWTHELVPELQGALHASGHAVFHLRPADVDRFAARCFPVFTADIARTGLYGFPWHSGARALKVALHDPGEVLPVGKARTEEVPREAHRRLRESLALAIPELAAAPVTFTRLCPYSDSRDGDFWIDRHPDRDGLVVAAGGAGHAFKFAPLLGGWLADAAEGKGAPERFRWRSGRFLASGSEAARCTRPVAGEP